jgi:hypothetical protein
MTRRLCGVAVLAACALAAAGCGGGTSSSGVVGDPISFQELARSATTSADATSGRFSFDMSLSFPGADEPFALSGEGAFDTASERASFAVDMSSFAKLLGGFVAGLGGANASDLPDFDDPDGWKIEVIQDGPDGYVRFPAIDDQLPAGKTWIRGGQSDVNAGGFDFQELESFTKSDPRKLLEALRSVSGDVETVGTEELHGVQTTHYRAVVDPAELAKGAAAGGQGGTADALVDQLAVRSAGDVPLDVWIDADGLVRRLSLELSSAKAETSQSSDVSISFELWDYGDVVEIELPPASQVADASTVGD